MPTRRQVLTTSAGALAAAALVARPLSATPGPIQVAAVLPLSGNLKIFGDQARIGLDLAIADINRDGGILGRELAVRFVDEGSDPDRGAVAVRAVVDDVDPVAIIGPVSSAVRNAMMPEIVERQIPLLYATNYEGGICNRYFFCFNTVPNQETGRLLPYLNARFGNRYFMLGSDYVWPRKVFAQAETIVADLGGETVAARYEPLGTSDFSDIIGQIAIPHHR